MQPKPLRRGRRPDRHHTVNPALIVSGVPRLVTFLVRTFDAVEVRRMALPDGAVIQAEVTIDDSLVMIMSPRSGARPMPCSLGIYADDVDATYERALAEGARSIQKPADQFYGHRTARIEDPEGNQWTIHTVIEEVSADELLRRSTRIVGRKSN
ncbi:MAG: VOC family protein [Labilithrix sp.]|nr:VOC family protein [Labilithrix sp.]MCW5835143.1 VOC family protein [Labilithrix sp.]